jgi:hypothetical protein
VFLSVLFARSLDRLDRVDRADRGGSSRDRSIEELALDRVDRVDRALAPRSKRLVDPSPGVLRVSTDLESYSFYQ